MLFPLIHFLPAFHMSANTAMLPVVQVTNLEIIFDPFFPKNSHLSSFSKFIKSTSNIWITFLSFPLRHVSLFPSSHLNIARASNICLLTSALILLTHLPWSSHCNFLKNSIAKFFSWLNLFNDGHYMQKKSKLIPKLSRSSKEPPFWLFISLVPFCSPTLLPPWSHLRSSNLPISFLLMVFTQIASV